MSSDWRTVKLSEVAIEVTVGFVGTMTNEYIDHGIPFLRSLNVDRFKINSRDIRYISRDFHSRISKSRLIPGDVVIVRTGKPGTCGVIPEELPESNCSDLVIVRCGSEILNRFFCYYVNSAASNHIAAHLVGAVQQHFNVASAKTMEIPLPPIQEQKAIAHILGTLDDKIELNRKTNVTLEAMAKELFKSWFVDFDPVRAKAEGRPTGLPAEISDLFPDSFEDSELGEIPSGWRVTPVGDVVECVGGSTPSTSEADYWDGGEYFWATPKDLSSLSEPFLLDTAKKITADGVQRISSGILPVGTVLLSSRAPVGYVAAACVPVSINQGFIALKSNGLMSSAYLLNWCLSNVQQFKDRASGTTFAEISKAAFRPIPLLVPSEQVARSFSDKAQALYERVVSNMRQSTLLAATRDALLPKLISGEIRIPDAEKMLDEVGV
jgi:type I restriction enzyme S subunit